MLNFFLSIFFKIWISLHDVFCFFFVGLIGFNFLYGFFYHLGFFINSSHIIITCPVFQVILMPPLFFSHFLKIALAIQIFRVVLLVVDISTLLLILLIFNFCFWSICKIFICFQFHHAIMIYYIYFFDLFLIFFIFIFFLSFLWVFYLSSISSFNSILWNVIFSTYSLFFWFFQLKIL
jgi:hypothetical protein